jgi:hypothetical protein
MTRIGAIHFAERLSVQSLSCETCLRIGLGHAWDAHATSAQGNVEDRLEQQQGVTQ